MKTDKEFRVKRCKCPRCNRAHLTDISEEIKQARAQGHAEGVESACKSLANTVLGKLSKVDNKSGNLCLFCETDEWDDEAYEGVGVVVHKKECVISELIRMKVGDHE